MPDSIEEIKELIKLEAEALRKEIMFYCDTKICLSQIGKGILYGKKMAYDKMLKFIDETGHLPEEEQ